MALTEQELQTTTQPSPQNTTQEIQQETQQEGQVPVVQSSTQIPNTFSIDGGRRQINLSALLAVAGKQNNIDKFVSSQARFKGRRQEIEQEIYTLLDELDSGKIKSRSAGKAYSVTQDVADPTGKRFDPRSLSLAYLDWIIDSLPQSFYVQPEKPKSLPKYNTDAFKREFEFAYGISDKGPEQNAQWHSRDYNEIEKIFTGNTQRLNQMNALLGKLLTNYTNGKYDFSDTGFRDEDTYVNQIKSAQREIEKILKPDTIRQGETPGDVEYLVQLLTPLMGNYFTNPGLLFVMPPPEKKPVETDAERAARVSKEKRELRAAADEYTKNMMDAYGNDEIDAYIKTLTSPVLPHKNNEVSIQLPVAYKVKDYDTPKKMYYSGQSSYGYNVNNTVEQVTEKIKSQLQRMLKSDFTDTKTAWVNNDHLASFLRYYFTKNDTLGYLNKGKTWKTGWLWSEELCNPELGLFWIYNPASGQFMTASVNSGPEEAKALVKKYHTDKKYHHYYDEYINKNTKKKNGGTINNLRALRNGGITKLETGNAIGTFSNKDWRQARAADPSIDERGWVKGVDAISVASDIISAIMSLSGAGSIASGGVGAIGSIGGFVTDLANDGAQWKDFRRFGTNLGLDALGMIPGVGAAAKFKKVAKVLPYVVASLGLWNFSDEAKEIIKKLEASNWNSDAIDFWDWLPILGSLAAVVPGVNRIVENTLGSKYLAKIDKDDVIKAVSKLDDTTKSKQKALEQLEQLRTKKPTKQNKEKIAELEKYIKNVDAIQLPKESYTQRGVDRIIKTLPEYKKSTKDVDDAMEDLFGYQKQVTIPETPKNTNKNININLFKKNKLRKSLIEKARGDYDDVVDLWEKKHGNLEDLDNIIKTISSKEGTYGAAFQKVKDLLNENKVPEYIVKTLVESKRSGGKINQLKMLRKGGTHEKETEYSVQLPEIIVQGKRKPINLGIKPVEADQIPHRIDKKFPVQTQIPTYDGGELPEVIVESQRTYNGGMLPEVVINGNQPTYYGGELPEVDIWGTNQDDVAYNINLPEIFVDGNQPIYDGGMLPEIFIDDKHQTYYGGELPELTVNGNRDNVAYDINLPEITINGKQNPLKDLKMVGLDKTTEAKIDKRKIDINKTPPLTLDVQLPELFVEGQRTYEGGMLPEVIIEGKRPTYDGGMLPEVTVTGKRNPLKQLNLFKRNKQRNNQLTTYEGGELPEVVITGEKKSYLKKGGIIKAQSGLNTEYIIGKEYNVNDTFEAFKRIMTEKGIDISNLTPENFTMSQAYKDILKEHPELGAVSRSNEMDGSSDAWSQQLFDVLIVPENNKSSESLESPESGEINDEVTEIISENKDNLDKDPKTLRGKLRKPVRNPKTLEDDVLYGNKFKKVSPMWDAAQMASTLAGINIAEKQQIDSIKDNIYLPSNQLIQQPLFRSGFDQAQEYERQQELNYNIMSQNQTTDANINNAAMLAALSQNNNLAIQQNALINKVTDQSEQEVYQAAKEQDALNYETAQERQKNLLAANKAIGDVKAASTSAIFDAVGKGFVQGKLNQQQYVTDYNTALKSVLDTTNATEYQDQLNKLSSDKEAAYAAATKARDEAITAANGDAEAIKIANETYNTDIKVANDTYTTATQNAQKAYERKNLMQWATLYRGIKVPGQNSNAGPDFNGVLTYERKNGGKLDKKEAESLRFLSKQLESQARSREKGLDRLSKVTYKAILKSLGLK